MIKENKLDTTVRIKDIPTNSMVIFINKNDKITYFASELKNLDLFLPAFTREINKKYATK